MKRPNRSTTIALPAATLGALAGAASASASIVYSGVLTNITAPRIGSLYFDQSIFFDLDQSSGTLTGSGSFTGADFRLAFKSGYSSKPTILATNTNSQSVGTVSNGTFPYSISFAAGATIGQPSGVWAQDTSINHNGGNNSAWASGTTGYLGLRINDGVGNPSYGWAQITYGADNTLNLHGFAYETDKGTPIQAGAIPEPSTYAALTGLLAGSAVLYSRRRKRAA